MIINNIKNFFMYGRQLGKTATNGGRVFIRKGMSEDVITGLDKEGNVLKRIVTEYSPGQTIKKIWDTKQYGCVLDHPYGFTSTLRTQRNRVGKIQYKLERRVNDDHFREVYLDIKDSQKVFPEKTTVEIRETGKPRRAFTTWV